MSRVIILLFCLLQFSCIGQDLKKINGVSFVASREEATKEDVLAIKAINANSAAVMPFGFIRDVSSCLLYTSDAADDLTRVDFWGCGALHKKKQDNKIHITRMTITRK